jgi:hypothetical protein
VRPRRGRGRDPMMGRPRPDRSSIEPGAQLDRCSTGGGVGYENRQRVTPPRLQQLQPNQPWLGSEQHSPGSGVQHSLFGVCCG